VQLQSTPCSPSHGRADHVTRARLPRRATSPAQPGQVRLEPRQLLGRAGAAPVLTRPTGPARSPRQAQPRVLVGRLGHAAAAAITSARSAPGPLVRLCQALAVGPGARRPGPARASPGPRSVSGSPAVFLWLYQSGRRLVISSGVTCPSAQHPAQAAGAGRDGPPRPRSVPDLREPGNAVSSKMGTVRTLAVRFGTPVRSRLRGTGSISKKSELRLQPVPDPGGPGTALSRVVDTCAPRHDLVRLDIRRCACESWVVGPPAALADPFELGVVDPAIVRA